MSSQPHRDWTGRELADHLQVKLHNMLTQLAEWARHGFLTNTGYGTYALNTPPTPTSSTPGDCAANGVSGPTRRAEVRRDGHCE